MGAWGSGSFENDTALDWAAGVASLDDVRATFDRLEVDAGPAGDLIDADLACELIAAAETVAMLMGRASADFPEDLRARLEGAGAPDDRLYHRARDAVCRVLRNSELAELWAEGAGDPADNEWHVAITGLVDRLNPDIEITPWEPEDVAKVTGKSVADCAFCDRPVPVGEHFAMSLYNFTDTMSAPETLSFHLACLNARLHHKHVLLDMKFDPDNLPDPDAL